MGTLQFFGTALELDGQALHQGDALEIRVLGSWLPGTVACDHTGWAFLTAEHVRIRLAPGLPARLVPPPPNDSCADFYGSLQEREGASTQPDAPA